MIPMPETGTRSQLVGLLQHLALCRPRRALLEEAEVELWSLYRGEQADLLHEAARLRAHAQGGVPESGAAWHSDRRAWRTAASECIAACACDGYPISPRLGDCLALPLPRWPSARDLADEARRLGAAVRAEG